ncbi:MAG: HAMP domain-containing sensor histidine kinase [Polyangiaceae bacterium]
MEFFPDGSHLLVGHIAWERERLNVAMRRELGMGFLLVLIMAAALAFIMSRAIARALAGPLTVASRFADGNLDARATPNASGDSFDRLTLTLNAMFARIQDLVGGIAHTTDAIAHDLRTPLARLKTRLEAARSASRDPAAQAEVEAAIAEADKLLATFQAMLRLARLEADTRTPDTPVDLQALAQDAAELFEALAEDFGQILHVQADAITVKGDRDQLFQLLVNLLDNAIKYSPAGSTIFLKLHQQNGRALLSVSDNGPGIPEADRERVFDRFVRLESHRGSPGNGLGLSLVRAIARHHGGRVQLEDARPGLRVVVELPLTR